MDKRVESNVMQANRQPFALPHDMISEIVLPNVVGCDNDAEWVPLGNDCYSLPLCLNVTEGYWLHLFRVKSAGVVSRHRHTAQVHLLTLQGRWYYSEKDWVAGPGSYIFEPPGDTHTFHVAEGSGEVTILSFVRGALIYVGDSGETIGYDDVFTRIDAARRHYAAAGLDPDELRRRIR
jgi:hypothetical protein